MPLGKYRVWSRGPIHVSFRVLEVRIQQLEEESGRSSSEEEEEDNDGREGDDNNSGIDFDGDIDDDEDETEDEEDEGFQDDKSARIYLEPNAKGFWWTGIHR